MAAYAALVSLMNDLELIPNHPTHSFSFDHTQITSLSQTVHFLIDFMETYDSQVLESQIAFAAHAAHDVIESHVVDQIHAGSTLGGKSRCYFFLDLEKAIGNMDFVKRKVMQFKAKSGLKAEQPIYSPPTSSKPLKNLMVGFDDVVVRLMEILTREPSSLLVIPMVGMGGMGKTTLARNVFDHLLLKHRFDVRIWATISQVYILENILTELVYGERKSTTGGDVSELGEKLHKMLWGRRYLIVLDDMWSVEAWDEIQISLPDNGNGSCVIVTTRLSNLAAHLSSSSPFEMNFLDDDKSWELFCGKAFGEEDFSVELEEIGKKIVKRCRGLPLSIVVIAGHLRRSSRAIEYWEKVANLMNPISSTGEDEQCLDILSSSYEHLPVCLKPCFLYMGMYWEDEQVDASDLMKFWVAEGFLKPKEGLSLEQVAEDYLNDLIDRNLIFVVERWWNGKVKYCVIHDIVRELCLKLGKKDKFMCVVEHTTQGIGIQTERRVVISVAMESAPLLRSLIRRGIWFLDESSLEFGLLRGSAIVNNMWLDEGSCLPPHFHQVNLRYLAFFCSEKSTVSIRFSERFYRIPSLFWNMQTMIIHSFRVKNLMPYDIWEMSQLRHLVLERFCLHDPDPSVRPKQRECIILESLQTLRVVNLRLTEEVCKRMPNVKVLSIEYDSFPGDYCVDSSYYCLHNLDRFNKLESLSCQFGGDSMNPVDSKWREVVLSLRFPSSVEELCLSNCHLHWEELTMMIKCLPRLGALEVDSVRGLEWSLDEEGFTHLKILRITGCFDLIYWNANSSHFPILEIFDVACVPQLSEIPFDIGEIPTLRHIQLQGCSISAAVSAMRIVVEQESLGNQDIRLEVDFWMTKEMEIFEKIVQEQSLISNNVSLSCNHK